MVSYPEFSERIFEFAFNAEFAARHHAVLAACPSLPTPQEEKNKGYDVEFELNRRGGARESLFLQHKVARHVTAQGSSNAHFCKFAGGSYFAFVLDNDQYNLIHGLSRRGRSIYYCAPRFTSRREIDRLFANRTTCPSSIWVSVANATAITDLGRHNIIYTPDGRRAARFSNESQELTTMSPRKYETGVGRHAHGLDRTEAKQLYVEVYEEVLGWWRRVGSTEQVRGGEADETLPGNLRLGVEPPSRLPGNATRIEFINSTAEILGKWYGVSWLIIGQHKPTRGADQQ
jgi:hypothetical protein